jgi:plastocyanin
MDRSELAKRYLDGQVSRRVFIRRLVTSGVSAMAAIAYADVLLTTPAAAAAGDFYIFVFDYGFSPDPAPLGTPGRRVEWGFSAQSSHSHSATDKSGMGLFDSGFRPPGSAFFRTFIAAGKYPYHCKETNHVAMNATIRVPILVDPVSAPLGTTFTITWASKTAPAAFVFDVQIKSPQASAFRDWKIGETVRQRSFTPSKRGQFQFQARLRKLSNGAHAGYCSPKTISVT